jgi:hypothetical protein
MGWGPIPSPCVTVYSGSEGQAEGETELSEPGVLALSCEPPSLTTVECHHLPVLSPILYVLVAQCGQVGLLC